MELCRSSPADPPGENVIQSNWQQPDVIGNKEKRVNQMAVRHKIRIDKYGKTKIVTLTARKAIIKHCKGGDLRLNQRTIPREPEHVYFTRLCWEQKTRKEKQK